MRSSFYVVVSIRVLYLLVQQRWADSRIQLNICSNLLCNMTSHFVLCNYLILKFYNRISIFSFLLKRTSQIFNNIVLSIKLRSLQMYPSLLTIFYRLRWQCGRSYFIKSAAHSAELLGWGIRTSQGFYHHEDADTSMPQAAFEHAIPGHLSPARVPTLVAVGFTILDTHRIPVGIWMCCHAM